MKGHVLVQVPEIVTMADLLMQGYGLVLSLQSDLLIIQVQRAKFGGMKDHIEKRCHIKAYIPVSSFQCATLL